MPNLRATYRLQLTPDFGFAEARDLVPYLRDLGISHLYLSPAFQARRGSPHGYDIVDPGRLSDALGGHDGFVALSAAAAQAGLGVVLDVVPNHMGTGDENRFWSDPELRAKFFDVDPVSGRHRRFFDIDELAGVRQEDPEVFETTMGYALSLVRDGLVDGLRVDHPDGLADPRQYLERLRAGGARSVWVEKILDPGEKLREWPVSGTVGYEFLNDVSALFVDPAAEASLTGLWQEVSGDERSFGALAHTAKLEQAVGTFRPELERLARTLGDGDADAAAASVGGLEALATALAALPVYRTYVEPGAGRVEDADRQAVAAARISEAIAARLLLEAPAPAEFVTRFQQTTPAIMAKGVEDTAFYRYARLLSLCEVGGDPSRFTLDVAGFHAGNRERARRFPANLLTTMTHDAKRSADVRARIGAIASFPEEFESGWQRFAEETESWRSADGAPDDVERYLLFQTLLGVWPLEPDRLEQYAEKALREAKRNTSWVEPNLEWEAAVKGFVRRACEQRWFEHHFGELLGRLQAAGRRSALAQVVLKLTCPGVPDFYQGDEVEYRALVDPDNRRPVDWRVRRAALHGAADGRRGIDPKLELIVTLLGLRRAQPELWGDRYEPLDAGDSCAFTRDGLLVVVELPRAGSEGAVVRDLPGGRWQNVVNGAECSFSKVERLARVAGDQGVAVFRRV